MKSLVIFFIKDQKATTEFYSNILDIEPTLNVPGMTEFTLPDKTMIGFMPGANIKNLLGLKLPSPEKAHGIPRSEIYLIVKDAKAYYDRALKNGAVSIQDFKTMPWGDKVAYCLDLDGHILAFAESKE